MLWAVQVIMPIFLRKKIGQKDPLVQKAEAGFSLLEILIVLAIMGVMMTLIAPRMVSSIESARFSRTVNLAAQQVSQLRAQAVLEKRPIIFAPSGGEIININALTITDLELPEGWQMSGDMIAISATGLCEGGRVSFTSQNGQSAIFKYEAPHCRAERISDFEADR